MPDTCWDAAANLDQLTIHPPEPTCHRNEQVVNNSVLTPYIPAAFLVRTSMTSRLSSAFHFTFLGSALMTDVMYSSMSFFCPCSSCRETERKIKGSRASLMSISGRLV